MMPFRTLNQFVKLVLGACLLACSLAYGQSPEPAAAEQDLPAATLEQRVDALEAYIVNGDPTASLIDAEGHQTNAAPATVGVPGPGHNGWMMTSAALVLFMTLPGLTLFYGGLVRSKNTLSIIAQCFGIAGLVTLLWWAFGYSFVFGSSFDSPWLGGLEFTFLRDVGSAPNPEYAGWVSHSVWAIYQMMFAIITPALIIGAIAERVKFKGLIVFVLFWMVLVYFPLAHMVWGGTGAMNGLWNPGAFIKTIDFAGGTVVHMSSGWSALALCILLGKRVGFNKEPMAPHSLVLCSIGTGMLWVGWYGFNAGSAVAADGIAANAFMTTTLAAATACGVWAALEYFARGQASVLGLCSGAVAGLVVITPAAGFVTANGAILMGVLGGIIPFFFCIKLKSYFGYDDALDTFGVHAVGGTLGAILTGFFATPEANPNLAANLGDIVGRTLWLEQLKAMGLTIVLSVAVTLVLGFALKGMLRPSVEEERTGMDISDHGEEAYNF
ncbi:MAG: ammonium transporter Amt family [Puniceicoccaceae bacterium 5H]|nr:MAG: ammonium transporter Amt family [Puniceicoccaceae bacterium 5H]